MPPSTQTWPARMNKLLAALAEKIQPEVNSLDDQRRLAAYGDLLGFLYGLPLALIGLIWLLASSDGALLGQNLPLLSLALALLILFSQLTFFLIVEIRAGRFANSDGSLDGVVLWSAVFLLGPNALWLGVLGTVVNFGLIYRRVTGQFGRWNWARNLVFSLATATLSPLIALAFYRRLGGAFPLEDLASGRVLRAFGALVIYFAAFVLIYLGYLAYAVWAQRQTSDQATARSVLRFILLAISLPHLSHPFGILAAGIYAQNGTFSYLIFLSGMSLVALLARQLSRAAEISRQQSRQLEKLEQLGRAIIKSPPDASVLSEVLANHVPTMFPSSRIAIWVLPDDYLLVHPPDWHPTVDRFWAWMRTQRGATALTAKEGIPWAPEDREHLPVIVTPIFDVETFKPIGGIYVELQDLVQPWDNRSLNGLLPAVQSLAAQVASALREAKIYQETLDHQRVTQELRLAGQIQASFLPNEFPIPSGWELAVTILPARETSGDYFDFITLSNDRLGILIADVADKGVGPALYMAMSRTLIRTYASEFDLDPDVVLFAANNRILDDARANLFVTAFYGVLDPTAGSFTYCNAGHNPPLLIRRDSGRQVQALQQTGIPIGIEPGAVWRAETVQIHPGDVLVLYTDGIPDAQNAEGNLFEQNRLLEVARSGLGIPAQDIQANIIRAVQDFVGEAPQVDDITLMVLIRAAVDPQQPDC